VGLKILKKHLLKTIRRKKQISNVIVFLDLLKFLFILFLIITVFSETITITTIKLIIPR
jgi:hypothetical protein